MHASCLMNRATLAAMIAALACTAQAADKPHAMDKMHDAPAKMHTDKKAPSDADMIASALKAAPANVAKGATIVTMDEKGNMHTLRKGSNGFTCMPDNPATPGPDPMCMDASAMEWVNAWVGHKAPAPGKVGFMYMLEGGTDASNTDPYATKPDAGNHWIKTGPHIMIVNADPAFYDAYPKSADPDTSQPYVMWAGTPYQHLMAPVR